MVGKSLNHYEILGPLGAGGMGEVYRAQDTNLRREVALKLLPTALSSDPERLARLQREAHLLAALNHPNIAAIHSLEQDDETRFLVMELVEGETLAEQLARGPLPVPLALETARQVAQALEAAHSKGIIHRDLKPANIKITPEGKVKVLDFGLAKSTDGVSSSPDTDMSRSPTLLVEGTQTGVILGTAAYMSPEQARGRALDKRTDIWSFGCVLFEMLTGSEPFTGDNLTDVLAAIVKEQPDWERLPPDLPPTARALLRRCLRKHADRRLHDIADARIEIEEAIDEPEGVEGIGVPGASTPPGARRLLPLPTVVAVAAVSMAVAGLAGWWLTRSEAPGPATSIRVQTPLTEHLLNTWDGSSLAISPDGSIVAYAVGETGEQEIHIRRLDQAEGTRLASGVRPFFSPDSAWVGFEAFNRDNQTYELRKVSVHGGAAETIGTVPHSVGAVWGAEGTIIFGTRAAGLHRISADGGDAEPLTEVGDDDDRERHMWPDLLPTGRHVLFTVLARGALNSGGGRIELLDLDTGARRLVQSGGTNARYVPTGHLVYVSQGTLKATRFDLDRLEAVGSPRELTTLSVHELNGGAHFGFASTGTLVYLPQIELARYPVLRADRSGRTETLLAAAGTYADPRLSPDGSRLALTVNADGDYDIWVYDLELQAGWPVAPYEGNDFNPVWSPDGKHVAFTSRERRAGHLYDIVRARADGTGEVEVLGAEQMRFVSDWHSPDLFAYIAPTTVWSVFVAPLSAWETEAQLVSGVDDQVQWPVFSPNGRWIAFQSDKTGRFEIYVRPYPAGEGETRVSRNGGGQPRWRADGRELFFRDEAGILATSVETDGTTFRADTPAYLPLGRFLGGLEGMTLGANNVHWSYDVSRDGQSFVVFPDVGQANLNDFVIVTNWFEELKRLVPTGR